MTAHKRIRPFNTKDTYPERKPDNDLCQAVVAKGTMDHICRIVIHLTGVHHWQDVHGEMGRWLKGVFPCSTGLAISALARPE